MSYNKTEIRQGLTIENIFELLMDFGGDPEYTDFGILSSTICHNLPGEGSRKLYYYTNTGLFQCYTGCGSFDPFELMIRVFKIQRNIDMDLNDAVRYVAQRFGIFSSFEVEDEVYKSEEWQAVNKYDRVKEIMEDKTPIKLGTYDTTILSRFNYDVKIGPWLKDGIAQNVLEDNCIGFYPGDSQITIPHYDMDGNFVGLRGRTVCKEDAARKGKYRPIQIGKVMYNHPLGMNLYNLNNSKNNIALIGKAIVFEGEKSALLYQTYFGRDNDISVACCGSNISNAQMRLLKDAGAKEVIVAFDRQFQSIGDDEYNHLTNTYKKLYDKYKNYLSLSFIIDNKMITNYKDSPIDNGADVFLELFKNRIIL